ncbi:Protein CBG03468 [Caenorhabditis briggsae]|uniref:Protein CBG03468 n=1 Tax=Caenorhabditis briggsae TaxID=6238 RepID=A8WV50_CAEBR|nr:Protein CBG03468 [Caenorhabditis briggsae]CAP24361.2 Protein CBG03468 [Caenorhabditis briggsae]
MSFADILDAKPKEPKLYQILGCDGRATTDQITAEYRSRVRDCHPDKVMKGEESTATTEKFVELQNAYSILTSETSRKSYDSWLHSPFPVTFEEFAKSQDKFQMSTHWAVPKTQSSIKDIPSESLTEKLSTDSDKTSSRWADGDRYQSSTASAFRNYEV